VSTLGVGVIGLGLVSPAHLDGVERADGARLAAVCDVDAATAERVAGERGVRGYTDHRALLADAEVEAVDLLLPHPLHHPVARDALEAGRHALVEKPFTLTVEEADDLIALAAARGLTLALAENTRFVHAYVRAAALLERGELGAIRFVRCFIPDQILDEWADRERYAWKREPGGTGAMLDCAPHMVCLLRWLFGGLRTIRAITQAWVEGVELDNHAVLCGQLENGGLYSVELSSLTEYPRGERVEIYGSEGTLVIDQVLDPPAVLYRGAADPHGTALADVPYDLEGWKARSIAAAVQDFVAAVRFERPPTIALEDASYMVRVLELAQASAAADGALHVVATGVNRT
jgi:predicted dehydrogenase